MDDLQCKKKQTSGVCGLYMFISVREQQFICGQPSSSAAAAPASLLASSCLAHDHPAETATRRNLTPPFVHLLLTTPHLIIDLLLTNMGLLKQHNVDFRQNYNGNANCVRIFQNCIGFD